MRIFFNTKLLITKILSTSLTFWDSPVIKLIVPSELYLLYVYLFSIDRSRILFDFPHRLRILEIVVFYIIFYSKIATKFWCNECAMSLQWICNETPFNFDLIFAHFLTIFVWARPPKWPRAYHWPNWSGLRESWLPSAIRSTRYLPYPAGRLRHPGWIAIQ